MRAIVTCNIKITDEFSKDLLNSVEILSEEQMLNNTIKFLEENISPSSKVEVTNFKFKMEE